MENTEQTRTGLTESNVPTKKATSISEEDSKRITAIRFLLIVFVIFIHNNLNADDAINYYHLNFSEPAVITWIKYLICGLFGGAAVPLFFLFAGFLQFSKDDSYPILLKKRAKNLLVPYVLWTLLGVLAFFIGQSIPRLSSFFQNPGNIVRDWNTLDWVNLFWSHDKGFPLVMQLWFVRDLMVLILLSPILKLLARKVPALVLTAMLLGFLNGLPLGFGTALFFYMAGFFFAEYKISFFKFADKINWISYAVLLSLLLLNHIAFGDKIALHGLGTIIPCLFFLKLSACIIKNNKVFAKAKYLAVFSFFLYAIHAPFLVSFLNKVSYRIIPLHGIGCLVQFLLPVIITVILGTAIGILMKKICPPVFKLLNGSR